jgi:hypothetical protein
MSNKSVLDLREEMLKEREVKIAEKEKSIAEKAKQKEENERVVTLADSIKMHYENSK